MRHRFRGHDLACHIMPSVIGRRPKGVVALCVCIFLYLLLGKENLLAETALSLEKLLTVIPEVRFSSTCKIEKGFRNSFRGPFFYAAPFTIGI
jgi:hypothetical protein